MVKTQVRQNWFHATDVYETVTKPLAGLQQNKFMFCHLLLLTCLSLCNTQARACAVPDSSIQKNQQVYETKQRTSDKNSFPSTKIFISQKRTFKSSNVDPT